MAEKQSNKERIKEITAGIEKGILELFESDRYRNYLTTMSRFHRYSLNNVMLIHAQRPDATLVAGFSKWKNSFTDSAIYKLGRITDDDFEKLDLIPEFAT